MCACIKRIPMAFWKSKAEDKKPIWSDPDGDEGPGHQSASSVGQTELWSSEAGVSPSGAMCVYFSVPALWTCFVFRLFCDFKAIWEARVSRVSFQNAVWGYFLKEVYMKARQTFGNVKICFSPHKLTTSRSWELPKRTPARKCLLQ